MEAADDLYMQRCLQLAALAGGYASPNPMVGAVLVHEGRIIGEGYHKSYGGPHAEPECLASVASHDLPLIPRSTLYVSLEPCAHFGKTPPCADLIISQRIPRVVIGCRDPFPLVNGKGIEKLLAAGIEVRSGVLEKECREINKRFFLFHSQHRPFIVLKWAQTADGKIASAGKERLLISKDPANRLVHRWRTEEMSIMVGTNTALMDDPQLLSRWWPGRQPVRLVLDLNLRLPASLRMLSDGHPTFVICDRLHVPSMTKEENAAQWPGYIPVNAEDPLVPQIMNAVYQKNIQSVLVEGGARLLQSFIDAAAWDEAKVITANSIFLGEGLSAPTLKNAQLTHTENCFDDTIRYYRRHAGNE